jgi:hypothetical protein
MDEQKAKIEAAVQSVLDEVGGKGLMAGAFGSLDNLLNLVVSYNVMEYFDVREKEHGDPIRRVPARALFNAVVALDSAADYLFHALPGRRQDLPAFLKSLDEPALLEIREIANAVKHCVRRRPEQLQAAEVALPGVTFEVSANEGVNIRLQFSVEFFDAANRSIEKAWQFWFDKSREIERGLATTD